MDQKQAYMEKFEAKLAEWQASIDKLHAQAKQAQADAQIDYQEQIEELRQRRDALARQLDELQTSQTKAWSDIKAGVEKAWSDMNKAMQDAWSRFD